MIKLKQCTKTFGDCTTGYSVSLDKEYTITEFINEILNNESEWGYVFIWEINGVKTGRLPSCEYRYGKLLSALPEEILNKKIIEVFAQGGWSRMDYGLSI